MEQQLTTATNITRRSLIRGAGGVLAAAGISGLLAACGVDGTTESNGALGAKAFTKTERYSSPATYNVSNIDAPIEGSKLSDYLIKIAKDWKAATGDTIDYRYFPSAEYKTTGLQTQFTSGNEPDIYMISSGDFLKYYNNGALMDLTPFLTESAIADYVPGILTSRKVDGKIYALPEASQPLCIFYSKKAFEAAHLSEADLPTTWDEMLEVAHKLTTKDQFGLLFETSPTEYQNFTWYPFLWMAGGDVVQGKKSVFESDATIDALNYWQRLIREGVAPRKALANTSSDLPANLGAGYCAMQLSGVWSVSQMSNKADDYEYGVFRIPAPSDGEYQTAAGGWGWGVNPNSPHKERAAQFLTWMLSSNTKQGIEHAKNLQTGVASNMPTMKSIASEVTAADGVYSSGVMKEFVQNISTNTRAQPRYPAEVWQAVNEALQSTVMSGSDAGTAAKEASRKIDSFMASYQGGELV